MSKFCTKCGTPLEDSAKFCPACGTPAQQAVQPQQPVQQQPIYAAQPAQQPVQRPQYNYGVPNQAAQQPVQRQQYNYGVPNQAAQQPAQPQQYAYAAPNGQQQYAYAPNGQPYNAAPKKSKKNLIIALSIIAVVVITGIVLLIVLLGGGSDGASSPEDLVNTLESLANDSSPSKDTIAGITYSYVFAKDDEAKRSMYDSLDATALINDEAKTMYGDDARITAEIIDSETYDAERLAEKKADYANRGYRDTDQIEEIRKIRVRLTIKGSKGSDSNTMSMTLIKVDGKWYRY